MTMRRRLFSLLLVLVLALGLGLAICPAAAEGDLVLEDKTLYQDHPLYIDLNLDANDSADDANFVVMQEGSVILYAESGMRMTVSEDRTSYTLYNPSDAARSITPGTPVAFIDRQEPQAYIFLPTQVAAQTDRIVFSCSPESVSGELLFQKAGLKYEHTFDFNHDFDSSTILETVKFTGKLKGQFYLRVFYNLISLEVETWVSYDLTDAVLEVKDNFSQEIPLAKISFTGIPGLGPEIGVGLGLAVEGDTKISFELTGGKTGFSGGLYMFHKPKFNSISEKAHLDMKEIIAEGSFEADLTLGPSVDIFSVAGFGCDIAAGVAVTAELTGDEGGRPVNPTQDAQATDAAQDAQVRPVNPNVWHVCKELSCLQGEIDELAKLEAWIQFGGHVASVHYDLFRIKLSDFHYSFTFKEFKMKPCQHYLYQVGVRVLEKGTQTPMEDVTVTYTEVPPYADRRGKDYIEGVTGEDGYVHLYMPAGEVKITATSWQDDPDTSVTDPHKVSTTVKYDVDSSGQIQNVDIELIRYRFMELVYFDENADGDTVENMPQPFWVEQDHTGNIPNEVPRREGHHFAWWLEKQDGGGEEKHYFPGDPITVKNRNIQLYAIWTEQPGDDFRTITYDPNGDNVVLPDNAQIYKKAVDGFLLLNPWRKDHIFTGWTCKEIGLTEPKLDVTVQWNQKEGNESDYVPRTYVANWKHVTYNVIWRNWDGSWLDVTRDLYNVEPTYEGPNPPVRPSDDSYFYVFAGWTPEIKVVTEDAEYTAVYTAYPLLKLISSPADQTLPEGEEAVFQVVAAGGEGPLTYQWYVIPAESASDGAQAPGGELIRGATTDTLCVTSSEEVSGNRYYCLVQDQVGQAVASDPAMLTLYRPAPQTGDRFPLGSALALLAMSGAALSVVILWRRKSRSL